MPWELLIAISIVAFAINSLLSRSLMKQTVSDPFAQTVVLFGLGGIVATVIALSLGKLHLPTVAQAPYFLLGGAVATIGAVLINKAYKLIEASEVGILGSAQKMWSVVGAFIFLGEPFSALKIIATVVIIIGVIIASWKHHTLKWDKGALFVIGAGMLFSVADIAGYYLLQTMNTFSFTALGHLFPVILLLAIRPSTIKHLRFYTKRSNFIKISIQSVFDITGTFCFFYAYTLAHNASTITPLTASRVILTVILGAIFLRERDNLVKKIIGGLIIVFGSVMLFL